MEKRVKIFFEKDVNVLAGKINNFLANTSGRLINITYESSLHNDEWGPSALLVYVPQQLIQTPKKEEEKDENKEEKEESGRKKSKKGDA